MEKFKLSFDDLKVETFNVTNSARVKGTVFANTGDICINCPTDNQPSCNISKPENGCPGVTQPATCGNNQTCVKTCNNTCVNTCLVSCAGDTCDVMTCDIVACGHPVTKGYQFYC